MPKKNSNSVPFNYENFNYEDYEYYGLHRHKKGRWKIDTKRMKENLRHLKPEMLEVMEKRNTKYFIPRYRNWSDYVINIFRSNVDMLSENWKNEYAPLLEGVKSASEHGNDVRMNWMMDGVVDSIEAEMIGQRASWRRQSIVNFIFASYYAQYIHMIASTIEAITVNAFISKDVFIERFTRTNLYNLYNKKTGRDIRELDSFVHYEKLYSVWNFLKHNSYSTFEVIKEKFPDLLFQDEFKVENGMIAINYLKLSEELLISLLDNIKVFLEDICEACFNENRHESKWNYDDWFVSEVRSEIEVLVNPLGLPNYL